MRILVIAEHDNQQLKPASLHVIGAAQVILGLDATKASALHVLVIGEHCQTVAESARKLAGVQQVLIANHAAYAHQLPENVAQLIAELAESYDYLLAGATTFGKNMLPRVAALLDYAMVSDVIEIVNQDTFKRPIYAGNAILTVQCRERIKILTIRTTAFPAAAAVAESEAAVLQPISNDVIPNHSSRFESQQLTVSARPELTNARIIIAGGRGLKSVDNFHLLEEIADDLGAALGASRAAVDAGFAPNDYQVGQTGKVVAPDLYIAVGISGAIQHLAGMKDSKVIVAINNDPEAPIMQIADYALLGDLFKILPELKAALRE